MVIAFLSALVATLIGLCACMAMNNMKKRWRSLFMGIANIPMLNAEIVTGISLMLVSWSSEISFPILTGSCPSASGPC